MKSGKDISGFRLQEKSRKSARRFLRLKDHKVSSLTVLFIEKKIEDR